MARKVFRKKNIRRFSFSNILAKDVLTEQLEERIVPAYVAGDFGWAGTFETTNINLDYSVSTTAVDSVGNVFQVGSFSGTVDFDPAAGTTNVTAVGGKDAFVVKLDSKGVFLWVKTFSGPSDEIAKSVTIDRNDCPIVTGWFQGTSDLDPSAAVYSLTSKGGDDSFIVKLSSIGVLQFAINIGSSGADEGYAVTTDTQNNIVIGGLFTGTVDFDPSQNISTMTATSGGQDIYVLKINSTGDYVWAGKFVTQTSTTKYIYTVATDISNNIIIGGWYNGTMDIDPSSSVYNITSNGGLGDGFVVKVNSSGVFQWGQGMGSNINDAVYSLTCDSLGNVYACGAFEGTVDFDASSSQQFLTASSTDAFLIKLSSSGGFSWVKSWGGNYWDFARSVVVDANNHVKVSSSFKGTVDFDPSSNVCLQVGSTSDLGTANYYNTGVSVFDTLGNFFSAKSIQASDWFSMGMALSPAGRPVLLTSFRSSMNFDPDAGNAILSSNGSFNYFVTQWNRQFTKTTVAVSDSLTGLNTTITATIQNENNSAFTGSVTFTDTFNGTTTTLGIGTVSNGVATLTLASMLPGSHSIKASYSGDSTNFSSVSNPAVVQLDTVAGSWGWAEAFVNRTGNEESYPTSKVVSDSQGNIYYAGSITGVIDFDAGTGTQSYASASSTDSFLAKLSPSGKLIWFRQWSNNSLVISRVLIDSQDHINIAGSYIGTFDSDPTAGSANLMSNGGKDAFLIRLNNDGGFIDSLSLGGTGDELINAIAYDSVMNIYLAGYFSNNVDFDLSSAVSNKSSTGGKDAFLVKYSPSMSLVWCNKFGSTTNDIINGVCTDSSDNVYIYMQTDSNIDIDPSSSIVSASGGGVTAKYNSSGQFLKQGPTTSSLAYYLPMEMIYKYNTIYVSGAVWNSNSTWHSCVISMTTDLTTNWSKQFDGSYSNQADIDVDSLGCVYITGAYNGTIDIDPSSAVYTLTSKGNYDAFVVKWDSYGNFVKGFTLGGVGEDAGHAFYDGFHAITISLTGAVVNAGYFSSTVDFDPTSVVQNLSSFPSDLTKRSRYILNLANYAVIGTATSLSTSNTSSVFGQSVTLSAALNALNGALPSGMTASFYDGATLLGTSTVTNGEASFTPSSLAVGAHSFTAKIVDSTNAYLTSTSSAVAFTVNKSGTSSSVSASANPTAYGQSVTLTASVAAVAPGAGTPTGSVSFKDGSTVLGTATLNGSGVATLATSSLTAGTHAITVVYAGDTNFSTSTSAALSQLVQSATATTLASSANPSTSGQSVIFTATVTGTAPGAVTPSGSVTFKDGTTTLGTGTLNSSGVASYSTSNLGIGSHSITAVYGADSNSLASTSVALSQSVVAGSASNLTLIAGDNQSATVASDFATLLQVKATDANGNPVPNVAVAFTVNANGASATFASTTAVNTDATGYATAPKLTANTVSGVFTVMASAVGLTPLTFTLTNNPGAAATITVSNGNNQSATVNTAFAQALQVRVTDSYGNPVGNVPVSFTAPSSGATGTFTGSASVTTNATGYASAPTFTANTVAGSYSVTTASTGLTSKTISLTNAPGAAASMTIQDGNNQSATVGTAFTKSLQLVVKDSYGNLVPGASVTFTAPSTGASGSFATSSTVTSNASGLAVSPAFTANTAAGSYNIAASSSGVSSVNFGMTNTAAAAAAITIADGNNQSTAVSTAFAKQLQVIAKDTYGNPVSGVSVVFTAPGSGAGGTFAGSSTILTGASGIAMAPAFTANSQSGSYNVTASATGLASLNFNLTNTVGAASVLTIAAGNSQSATVGTDFATLLKVRATDSKGNPVPNTAITFTVNSNGAGGSFASSNVINTDASGYASAPKLTANTVAGSFTVTASTSGASSLTFNLSNKAGAASGLVLSGGNSQATTVNTAFGQALQVRVVDAYGNGVANVPVTFGVPSSGATASFITSNIVSTDANGYATAPTLTANTIAGSYNVTASSAGLASQIFSLTNNPGAAAALVIQDGNLQSATVNTAYGRLFQVIAKDAYGNAVPGVSVLFTAPSTGAGGSFAASSSVVTDSSGTATAPAFKAGTVAGAFQVTAASTGLTTQNFALTNLPGAAMSMAIVAGNNQTATVGNSFATTLQVLATDSFGNGVPGVQVLYTAPGSGASGSFAGANLVTTNSQGVAVANPFSANAVSGSYTVTASAPGLNTQSFSLTNSTGGALINITGGNNQTTTVGTGFGSALQVKFTDSFGNPVQGISVTFSAPASGPGVSFGGPVTVVSNASGVATSPAITANGKAGSFTLTASAANIGSVNFNLTNTPGAAAAIVAASGNNQSATVNTPFGLPVVARVTDTYGNPVANVPVTFSEPGSGALAIFGGSSVVTSNAEGIVSSPNLTANTISGSYTITASAPNVTSAQFTLTNTAGLPTAIVKTGGNNQAAVVNSAFASALAVKVSDIYGNPVPNVNVSFSGPVIGSGLAFSGASTVQTNAQGIAASPGISANSAAGSFSVQAYVSGSVTETFSLTNLAGSASKLSLVGGNNQNTIVNNAFGAPLQLLVTDAYNNPVSNASVTFTSPSNGSGVIITGSPSAASNASGQVSWSGFMANQVAGTYAVLASLANGTNVPFTLTNKAGTAAIANVVAGSNQSATVNVAYAAPLQLKVTDAYGNPVPNVPVSFSAPATGASAVFASQSAVNSNADGLVSSPAFTANTIAGTFTAIASVGSIGQINFTLSNQVGAVAQISKYSGNNQSTQVDTAFANPLQVKVTDAYGNPVANAQVQFKLPATGATAIPASTAAVSTNLQGLATLPSLTASRQAGSFQVNLTAGTNITENFTLANLAGPAAKFNIMAGNNQSATVNTAFTTGLKVLVTDAFNNPVANVPVAFTVPTSGPSASVSGSSTINTSASGFAELAGLTANTVAGSFTVVAAVPGIDSLNFSFTNSAGAAANLSVVSGGGQSAVVRAFFASPLAVKVTDTYGNPVAGTAVTFTAPATGATLAFAGPATVNTDNAGIAQAPSAAAGAIFGNFAVTATAPGLKPATFSLTNSPPTLQGISVQQGSIGRSFVRYVDLAINDPATVSAIVSSLATTKPLIRLTNTGLDGKTKKSVSLAGIAKANGNLIQIDFGAKGLGGNATSNAADGSYLIELDIDGNGTFETAQRFFRLLGDVNGDKVVDAKDSALVKASLNKTGVNLPADTNGDGKVNASDTSYVKKAQKRKIKV